MANLPTYRAGPLVEKPHICRNGRARILTLCCVAVLFWLSSNYAFVVNNSVGLPLHVAEAIVQKCSMLHVRPGPPADFAQRSQSDRFVGGTRATLLRNASVWTGDPLRYEILGADILLDKGMIKWVGHASDEDLAAYGRLVTVDVDGSWVTPGIVDMHSHIGVYSIPELKGAIDLDSSKGPILPWLRSLDGLNTRDVSYQLSISGGVTTANILPGSDNAIGGQAFVIKLRPTQEQSPSSMLLEPPYSINDTRVDPAIPLRWRQMKHACGENPRNAYGNTRMDNIWVLRQAYDTARKIKERQDTYCAKALAGEWNGLGEFPEDLQWEALVDVLRGRVKVHTHCYEEVDFDDFVRLSNEFKFPVAAFHHGHEAYLVPGILKSAYNSTPAVALFANIARYKREAYRGSEFAPRILAENGIDVVLKSDHPVLNSRYLLFEAQQAHYYGLPADLALSAITSTPAKVLGIDHRVGFIREGYDADIVVWDSHPLALGATPKQVWIDGIAQIGNPYILEKPVSSQSRPVTPDFEKEMKAAIEHKGLPPLAPIRAKADTIVFTNVSSIYKRDWPSIQEVYSASEDEPGVVVVRNGQIVCFGSRHVCPPSTFDVVNQTVESFDLRGGSISPGLVSYGSPLGLEEILAEQSTHDGVVLDPLSNSIPNILAGHEVISAVDGLQFAGRDTLLAYRAGVTSVITPPTSNGLVAGLSVAFSTGAAHALEEGAIIQDTAALHVGIGHRGPSFPSVSSQITALRHLLLDAANGTPFDRVGKGEIPLVVQAQSADIIASLIKLKKEIETKRDVELRLTVAGAAEAHLLARHLGEANVGVILTPAKPSPLTWEMKRALAGPPLILDTAITTLLAHGVKVGIGVSAPSTARNTRFDAAWAALDSNGRISPSEALALASTRLEELLGVESLTSSTGDLVATLGGSLLDLEARVVGIISPRGRGVEWLR